MTTTLPHVVLYASDHGYGHAIRMMVLAEHLHHSGVRVTLCLGAANRVVAPALQRLSPPPQVLLARLDPGVVPYPDRLAIDEKRTRAAIGAWLAALPGLVDAETGRLRALRPDLVIADAPAVAVVAAARAGARVAVCSNFTWLDIYGDRYGADVADALAQAYWHAAVGLRLQPGRMRLQGVGRVRDVPGVLGRRARRSRAAVRAELGLAQDEPVLYLGLGRSLDPSLQVQLLGSAPQRPGGARVLASTDGTPGDAQVVVGFPSGTLDAQDFIAASDAALCKAGYSTLAEAALAGVPTLAFPVVGFPESDALCAENQELGYGLALSSEAEARHLLADPAEAIQLARRAQRRSGRAGAPDAWPALRDLLVEEGLIELPLLPPPPAVRPPG